MRTENSGNLVSVVAVVFCALAGFFFMGFNLCRGISWGQLEL